MSISEREKSHQKQHHEWTQILVLSGNILTAAQCSDWQTVDRLANIRETRLEAFFRQAIESTLVSVVQQGIAEMMQQDEEIVRLVKKNQDELANELLNLQARRKQIKDYISNSE